MKKIHNLIIVDESGSMCSIEKQAVSGMLETIQSIKASQQKTPDHVQTITLLTFNSQHLDFVYNCSLADSVDPFSIRYMPSGCTPLYDAIGKGISLIKEVADKGDIVIVTIITDGYENASSHYSLNQIKRLIEQQKEMGWTVALIGTDDLDVGSMARSMSISDHLSFSKDERTTLAMFSKLTQARDNRICMAVEDGAVCCASQPFFDTDSLSSDDVDSIGR